jgi:cyclophilin family peptidyl-prolyl cis-trans isomerase
MKTRTIVLIIAIVIIALIAILVGNKMTGNAVKENPQVRLQTSEGSIVIELYPEEAPITVENFLAYVREGAYAGTVFHRVIPDFMVQGGGFTPDGKQKSTHAPITLESNNGLKNDKYTVAMARTNDPNSATNQFFINVNNNDFLNYGVRDDGYAVFGKVIKGTDVVDKIGAVRTTTKNGMADWPVKDVIIEKAEVI